MATLAEFNNAINSPQVRIVVGKDNNQRGFLIPGELFAQNGWLPEDLLVHHTSKESSESIVLPEESPTAFAYYHYFIYHHDVAFPDPPAFVYDRLDVQAEKERQRYVHELCQTWVFGDKYNVPGLQNCAMYKLCEVLREGSQAEFRVRHDMSVETMKYCYEDTAPEAKLRNLVADHVVFIAEMVMVSDPRPQLLQILSRYDGFTQDVYKALQGWHEENAEVTDLMNWRARYEKPLKYAERYEVDVINRGNFATTSHAVWRTPHHSTSCYHCGGKGAKSWCSTTSLGDFDPCMCGGPRSELHPLQLCDMCQPNNHDD